jgi:ribonuclease P protein component
MFVNNYERWCIEIGKNVSTQETSALEGTRLSQAHEDEERAQHTGASPRTGTQETVRVMKTVSLKENRDFRRLYHKGQSVVGACMVIYTQPNRLGCNRLGITASTKVGGAVERNRARRRLKESFRLMGLKNGFDVVIVARKRAVTAPFYSIQTEMRELFIKIKML